MTRILSNQAICAECGDAPFSRSRHDYKVCECGEIAVDGGMDYLRRTAGDLDNILDISIEVEDDTYVELDAAMKDGKTNDLGKICAIARILRDAGSLYGVASASSGHSPAVRDAPERREAGASNGLLSQGS